MGTENGRRSVSMDDTLQVCQPLELTFLGSSVTACMLARTSRGISEDAGKM